MWKFGKSSVDRLEEAIVEWRVQREADATQRHNEMVELRAQMAVLEDKVRPLTSTMELAWEKVDKAIKRLNYRESAAALRAQAEEDQPSPPAAPLSPVERLRARRARRK